MVLATYTKHGLIICEHNRCISHHSKTESTKSKVNRHFMYSCIMYYESTYDGKFYFC